MNPIFSYSYLFPALGIPMILFSAFKSNTLNLSSCRTIRMTDLDLFTTAIMLYIGFNTYYKSFSVPRLSDYYSLMVITLLYILVRLYVEKDEMLTKAVTFIAFLGAYECIIAFIQLLEGKIILGSLGSRAILANFLATVFPFLCYAFINALRRKKNIYRPCIYFVALALSVFLVTFHSMSRTAFLAIAMTAILIVLTESGIWTANTSKLLRNTIIFGFITATIVTVFGLLSLKGGSNSGRLFVLIRELELLRENILLGIGFGNFDKCYNDFQGAYFANNSDPKAEYLASYINVNYNEYLDFLLKGGVIGMVFMIAFLRKLLALMINVKPQIRVFVFSTIAVMILGLFSYPSETMSITCIFTFGIAVLASQDRNARVRFTVRSLILTLVSCLISLALIVGLLNRYNMMMKWHIIATSFRTDQQQPNQTKLLFAEVFPELENDPVVMTNYARNLSKSGDFTGAIECLNRASLYSSNYAIFVLMGECYENLGDFRGAERSFLRACYLVPNLFYQRYRLMRLYKIRGMNEQALEWANKIIHMPVKVNLRVVREIREVASSVKAELRKGGDL